MLQASQGLVPFHRPTQRTLHPLVARFPVHIPRPVWALLATRLALACAPGIGWTQCEHAYGMWRRFPGLQELCAGQALPR